MYWFYKQIPQQTEWLSRFRERGDCVCGFRNQIIRVPRHQESSYSQMPIKLHCKSVAVVCGLISTTSASFKARRSIYCPLIPWRRAMTGRNRTKFFRGLPVSSFYSSPLYRVTVLSTTKRFSRRFSRSSEREPRSKGLEIELAEKRQ